MQPAKKTLLSRDDIHSGKVNDHVKEYHFDAQSTGFMTDIIPIMTNLYKGKEGCLTVFDVGARTASGTRLLSQCFSPYSNSAIKMNITAIDLDSTFFYNTGNPYFNFRQINIFDEKVGAADLVICSHTIEHVPDILGFIYRLQEIARDYVLIACPLEENIYSYWKGHERFISSDLIVKLNPIENCAYYSAYWLNSKASIFVLPGLADVKHDVPWLDAAKAYYTSTSSNTNVLRKLKNNAEEFPFHAQTWNKIGHLENDDESRQNAMAKAATFDPSWFTYTTDFLRDAYFQESGKRWVTDIKKDNDSGAAKNAVAKARYLIDANPYTRCISAEMLERVLQLREAAHLFNEAGRDFKIANAYYRSGLLYRRMKEYEKADQVADSGLSLSPDSPDLNWLKAVLFLDRNEPQKALPFALRAANQRRYLPRMTEVVARIFDTLGNKAEAMTWAELAKNYKVH